LVAVDPARGLEPAGLNLEAKELDPAFVPDHSDRMAWLAAKFKPLEIYLSTDYTDA